MDYDIMTGLCRCRCGHSHATSRIAPAYCLHTGSDGEFDCKCRNFRKYDSKDSLVLRFFEKWMCRLGLL